MLCKSYTQLAALMVFGRIPTISVSWTSDDVTVTSSEEAELFLNGYSFFYIDVSIRSKDAVASDVINARVCFTAIDNFG